MLRTPPAAPKRAPSPLLLVGSADDGDIGFATTLPSPPLGLKADSPVLERPTGLRRASSHHAPSSGSSSPGLGISAGVDRPRLARKRKSTLTRVNALPTTLLPADFLARLHDWIETVAITNFDLDRGPEFDNCYPPLPLSAQERHAIAFSSFPDHNERGDLSLIFSWRLPRLQADGVSATGEYLHGHCYFCQQKNPNIRRGYAQRSLSIITKHARLGGLFSKLVSLLGETYFRERGGGSPAAETAMYNICRWPAPTPGTLELPFLNHILSVEIPLAQQAQYRLPRSSSHLATNIPPPSPASIPVMASLPSSPLSGLLRELISQMWLIWELVILAEPILVYSADTRRASELVQWLTAIVRPLPYGGDYRPFFHIHTPDFAHVLNNKKPRPGIILGSTNPLILSAARHYPHVLRISPPTRSDEPVQGVFGTLARSTATGSSFKDAQTSSHGVFSERKRHIKKDPTVLKLAEDRVRAGDYGAADSLLLQCFSTLTERFLVPLNRYFATLLPADAHNGMSMPQQTRQFDQTKFLLSLKQHGTPLPFRKGKMPSIQVGGSDSSASSSAVAFYEAFLRSPNFMAWLRDRSETMQNTSRSRYLHRLETGNAEQYLQGKSDAEVSELISRLESEALITEQELRQTPSLTMRQRSASYDINMQSPTDEARRSLELKNRSQRLRSQVERVKAIRSVGVESSEDSDGSSLAGSVR